MGIRGSEATRQGIPFGLCLAGDIVKTAQRWITWRVQDLSYEATGPKMAASRNWGSFGGRPYQKSPAFLKTPMQPSS